MLGEHCEACDDRVHEQRKYRHEQRHLACERSSFENIFVPPNYRPQLLHITTSRHSTSTNMAQAEHIPPKSFQQFVFTLRRGMTYPRLTQRSCRFYDNKQFSDVTISIEATDDNSEIFGHKNILSMASGRFRRIFEVCALQPHAGIRVTFAQ